MNSKSIIAILIALAIGLLVAFGGGQDGTQFGSISLFLFCGLLAFGINWLAFVPANIYQTEKYYDLTGSLTYLTLIIIACALAAPLDLRSGLVALMVAIWALRLGSFLFQRINADGKDVRFDKIKTQPLIFFRTWTLQGTWVIMTIASALMIITSQTRLPLDGFLVVGFAMWVIGFVIEIVADGQKSKFRANPENKGRFISSGIWAWSRHPNYFGEILLWTGVTVMSLPLLSGWQWVTIVSPIFVTFLLTRVSGVPMLEAGSNRKWGAEQAYIDYRDRTPVLIPMPPKK